MLKNDKFTYKNKTYEVRAEVENNEARVRLYENDKRASPLVYCVNIETIFDAKMRSFPLDLVDGLMELVKAETVSGRLAV